MQLLVGIVIGIAIGHFCPEIWTWVMAKYDAWQASRNPPKV